MRLKSYINEKKYIPNKKEIQKAMKAIIKRNKNVKSSQLEYLGTEDYSEHGLGILYYFNIVDPKHPMYKSTIGFNSRDFKRKP
jgi:hypothetical protein